MAASLTVTDGQKKLDRFPKSAAEWSTVVRQDQDMTRKGRSAAMAGPACWMKAWA